VKSYRCQVGNLGGATNTSSPSNSNGNSSPNDGPNGNPNSGNSGSNRGGGDQGSKSGGNDPQDSGPDPHDLNKIILDFRTGGGPLEHWGIQGTIRIEELVQFTGDRDPRTYQWMLQSRKTTHTTRNYRSSIGQNEFSLSTQRL